MTDLDFAQEYGPRILAVALLLLIGLGIWAIARRAAAGSEFSARKNAAAFKTLNSETARKKRAKYEEDIDNFLTQARSARTTQAVALWVPVIVLVFFGSLTLLTEAGIPYGGRWAVSLGAVVVLVVSMVIIERLHRRERTRFLAEECSLDPKAANTIVLPEDQ